MVPETAAQVTMEAFMVESVSQAEQVRQQWMQSDNVTALVEEYAVDTYADESKGLYDWHPASLMDDYTGSVVP
jgi:hypothetical protein